MFLLLLNCPADGYIARQLLSPSRLLLELELVNLPFTLPLSPGCLHRSASWSMGPFWRVLPARSTGGMLTKAPLCISGNMPILGTTSSTLSGYRRNQMPIICPSHFPSDVPWRLQQRMCLRLAAAAPSLTPPTRDRQLKTMQKFSRNFTRIIESQQRKRSAKVRHQRSKNCCGGGSQDWLSQSTWHHPPRQMSLTRKERWTVVCSVTQRSMPSQTATTS